jgi:hypothetical protein
MKRLKVAAVLLAATLAVAGCGSSHRATISPRDYVVPQKHVQSAGALGVPVPVGFHRYAIRRGIYRKGTRPPAIGVAITDYRLKGGPRSAFVKWSRLSSKGPPANRVALAVTLWLSIGPGVPTRLHLPLSLNQPWNEEHLRNGTQGYRWGYLSFHGQIYEIFFWSGRAAPPHDRTALLNTLTSIHPAP